MNEAPIKCICGKIFKNKKSFSEHTKRCSFILDPNSLEMQNWIEEKHICEKCGVMMSHFYGTGRFCSKSCAASHKKSDNSRLKTSQALLGYNINFEQYIPEAKELYFAKKISQKQLKYYKPECIEGIDYILCPYCGVRVSALVSHVIQHGKNVQDVRCEFGIDCQTTSRITKQRRRESSKIIQRKLIDEGRHQGWQSRTHKSYAEEFWEMVLQNNNIQYQSEFVVNKRTLGLNDNSNYFLDFLLPGNVDLEIDGKQHLYLDRLESDKIRDELLFKNGYIVYRIPWINPNTDDNKEKVKQQIDSFLAWYNELIK